MKNLPLIENEKDKKRGHTQAIDRLFNLYAPRVMGYLILLTGNRSEAEDLTQETFLAAFAGIDRFEGRSQTLTWLLGIARRRLYDRTKRPAPSIEPLREETIGDKDPANRIALAATLSAALEKLKEPEREVILLTAVQGLSYREAAEVLGEPVGTIKWRAHEATKQLRQILNAADERYEAQYGTSKPEPRTERNLIRFSTRPNR